MARGRPSSARHPSVAVLHLDTGNAVAWSDGEFAGDEALVADARVIAKARTPVQIGVFTATPSPEEPTGALVAMISACRGRAAVFLAPPEPMDLKGGCSNVQEYR